MANSITPRMYGDDYQALYFWMQICRLFEYRTKVVSVGIEAKNIKSLDDIVVNYSGMYDGDDIVKADYFQVKFHMTANGSFTWKSMMAPAFINASSVSFLKRLHNAQMQFAPDGKGCRFYVYSPWFIHPEDPMSKLVNNTDGQIRWETLSEGGDRSEMGKIRKAWKEHLGLTSDDDLLNVLTPLRIKQGPTYEELAKMLNDKLQIAGLKPVTEGSSINQYVELARTFIKSGRSPFTKDDIEKLCKREGLWLGTTMLSADLQRLGIRSFLRFAEHLEDETDNLLCLLKYFNGRHLYNHADWNGAIIEDINNFFLQNIKVDKKYLLYLSTHGSIAFLSGWFIGTKSGVDITLVQSGPEGRRLWKPSKLSQYKPSDIGLNIESISLPASSNDVALAIGITHNIIADVNLFIRNVLPSISRIISVQVPTPSSTALHDADHAYYLAQEVSNILKAQRTIDERSGTVHIFCGCPNAFAFYLGQMAKSFGKVVYYEYNFDSNRPGSYVSSFILPPDNTIV